MTDDVYHNTDEAMNRGSRIFHRFPDLPTELRDLIWTFSLPELMPCLFSYRRGLWRFRKTEPSEAGYDFEHLDLNIIHEFCYDLLDHVQMKIPLSAVNTEAHMVVLRWAQTTKAIIHKSTVRSSTTFSYPFNPGRDILYVSMQELNNFEHEPIEFVFRSGYLERTLNEPTPWVQCIAVPAAFYESDHEIRGFADTVVQRFSALREIILLSDSAPSFIDYVENSKEVRERWELLSEENQIAANNKLVHDFRQSLQKWWIWEESIPKLTIHYQSAIKR